MKMQFQMDFKDKWGYGNESFPTCKNLTLSLTHFSQRRIRLKLVDVCLLDEADRFIKQAETWSLAKQDRREEI